MFLRLLALLGLVLTAGCVKIQTQSETPERRTEAADLQGKDFRVTFAESLRRASAGQKFALTKNLIDSVSANYLRYGANIADQWHQAAEARKQPVTDVEMRDLVTRSNQTQEPLTQAYEESIDYGIDQIKLSQGVDPTLTKELESYRDHFYKVYNGVFFPKGTEAEYENRLSDLRSEGAQMSRQLDDAIRLLR